MITKALAVLQISLLSLPNLPFAHQGARGNAALGTIGANLARTPNRGLARLASQLFSTERLNCASPLNAGLLDGSTEPLLEQSVTGVDATTDVTADQMLNAGFQLSGTINGSLPSSIVAQAADGTLFGSQVNQVTHHYVMVVPAGTFTLSVCFGPAVNAIATFNDPVPVDVAADTVRDVTLPTVTTSRVSGTLSGLDPAFIGSLRIGSADYSRGGFAFVIPISGAYQLQLPDGSYNVMFYGSAIGPIRTEMIPLGSLTVSGGDVMADFSVPPISVLSGTVSIADGSPIPDHSLVLVFDALAPGGGGCAAAGIAGGSAVIDPSSGTYSITLPTGGTYRLIAVLPVQPMDPPQDASSLLFQDPDTFDLPTDTMRDVNIPAIPGTVQITGTITDPGGLGVASTKVTASTDTVTGAPNVLYGRAATTDANGVYRLVVLNGTNYRLDFNPPQPQP